nr:hypothetical protein [Streptomyces albireticuli]
MTAARTPSVMAGDSSSAARPPPAAVPHTRSRTRPRIDRIPGFATRSAEVASHTACENGRNQAVVQASAPVTARMPANGRTRDGRSRILARQPTRDGPAECRPLGLLDGGKAQDVLQQPHLHGQQLVPTKALGGDPASEVLALHHYSAGLHGQHGARFSMPLGQVKRPWPADIPSRAPACVDLLEQLTSFLGEGPGRRLGG